MGPLFYGSPAEDGRTDGLCTDKALRIPLRQKVKETRVEGIEEEGGADAKERASKDSIHAKQHQTKEQNHVL